MDNLTIIIPYWNGQDTIEKLIATIPPEIPIVIIDDLSDVPYQPKSPDRVTVYRPDQKGYFTGAVNRGIQRTKTDVLVLNQDVAFTGTSAFDLLASKRTEYDMIGERIGGNHPAWRDGYIHGTFMYISRRLIDRIGLMNEVDYPLWGSTCEYQLRAARAGYKSLALETVPAFIHKRHSGYGKSITEALRRWPGDHDWFIRTPPEISVIIPCYNQGRFLTDAVNSLIGGETSLGYFKPQTFQSFEIIIVNDASPDETHEIGQALADPSKAIRYIKRNVNGGTPAANNTGVRNSHGRFITVLCADDMMESHRLDTLYERANADPSKVYYDDLMTFTDGKRKDRMPLQEYDFDKLIYKNQMHCGIFYARKAFDAVGGYPVIMKDGREDWAINVGLGLAGYCGQHVPEAMYLYRRQDHNRTLTNTSPKHHEHFLRQIMSAYPTAYNGGRPMACCGKSTTQPTTNRTSASARVVPLSVELDTIQYNGNSFGAVTFYGVVSGKRYRAGLSRPLVIVDKRDLVDHGRGLLELSENGKKIFTLYRPEPVQAEPPQAEPEPEMMAMAADAPTVDEPAAAPAKRTRKKKTDETL